MNSIFGIISSISENPDIIFLIFLFIYLYLRIERIRDRLNDQRDWVTDIQKQLKSMDNNLGRITEKLESIKSSLGYVEKRVEDTKKDVEDVKEFKSQVLNKILEKYNWTKLQTKEETKETITVYLVLSDVTAEKDQEVEEKK